VFLDQPTRGQSRLSEIRRFIVVKFLDLAPFENTWQAANVVSIRMSGDYSAQMTTSPSSYKVCSDVSLSLSPSVCQYGRSPQILPKCRKECVALSHIDHIYMELRLIFR
jgi:hypothetical protein